MRQWIALILGMSTAVVAAAATNGTDSETIRIDDDDVRVSELREAIDDIADDADVIAAGFGKRIVHCLDRAFDESDSRAAPAPNPNPDADDAKKMIVWPCEWKPGESCEDGNPDDEEPSDGDGGTTGGDEGE